MLKFWNIHKINVRLSLCLTKYHAIKILCLIKHHAMKTYLGGDISPRFSNLHHMEANDKLHAPAALPPEEDPNNR
jgi:hypothetical protein